jgi:nanoRNase/pAp phosphatase (c-di-AMP/oligoRNAs hydrolase)
MSKVAEGVLAIPGVGAARSLLDAPVLLVAVLAGVAVLGAVAWLGMGRLRRTQGDRFERALGRHDAVAVLMHPNPDPDAMASAVAVATIADHVGTDVTLYYPGRISHQENRAFETVLDLGLEHVEAAGEMADLPVVLVDHNEPRGFAGSGRVEPFAVVDHHPGGGEGKRFTDVRPEYGSCATIFAEYFEETGWIASTAAGEDDDRVIDPRVATALIYGIQSDTNRLTKGCTVQDFQAAAYLYPGVDRESLDRIANPEVDAEVLDVKARAITNRVVESPFAFSNVGEVTNVDAIPQAADELLRLEGVTAVVVAGERDGTMHLSGRSRDDRVHMGKTLREAVDDIPMAEAGGHARMGGGQLSVDHMEGLGPSAGLTRQDLADRLFTAMSGSA